MRTDRLRSGEWVLIAVAVVSLALSIIYYPRLPQQQQGVFRDSPDGSFYYSGYPHRLLPTFAVTALISISAAAYILIPRLRRPCPDNRYRFYDQLLIFTCLFWLAAQLTAIYAHYGGLPRYSHFKFLFMLFIACFLFSLGNAFAHGRPDWFISIKNRWTIGDPRVWELTHRRIGTSFKVGAAFMVIQAVTPMPYALYPASLALLLAEFYIFVYPFYLHRILMKADSTAAPDENQPENAPRSESQQDRSQT